MDDVDCAWLELFPSGNGLPANHGAKDPRRDPNSIGCCRTHLVNLPLFPTATFAGTPYSQGIETIAKRISAHQGTHLSHDPFHRISPTNGRDHGLDSAYTRLDVSLLDCFGSHVYALGYNLNYSHDRSNDSVFENSGIRANLFLINHARNTSLARDH